MTNEPFGNLAIEPICRARQKEPNPWDLGFFFAPRRAGDAAAIDDPVAPGNVDARDTDCRFCDQSAYTLFIQIKTGVQALQASPVGGPLA